MQMALESAFRRLALLAMIVPVFATLAAESPPLHRGYYSEPAVHGETIVFTSEGDLWTVDIHGGAAGRRTAPHLPQRHRAQRDHFT
jgi:tricorn protease